jgi:inosose dehydratase
MNSRRQFIKLAGTGIIATGTHSVFGSTGEPSREHKQRNIFKTGIAGYTFSEIDVEKAIGIMKTINVTNLSLKDVFLPLNSTLEVISAVKNKLNTAGINIYTVGVIDMKTREDVDQAFEYARMTGVKMIRTYNTQWSRPIGRCQVLYQAVVRSSYKGCYTSFKRRNSN